MALDASGGPVDAHACFSVGGGFMADEATSRGGLALNVIEC